MKSEIAAGGALQLIEIAVGIETNGREPLDCPRESCQGVSRSLVGERSYIPCLTAWVLFHH